MRWVLLANDNWVDQSAEWYVEDEYSSPPDFRDYPDIGNRERLVELEKDLARLDPKFAEAVRRWDVGDDTVAERIQKRDLLLGKVTGELEEAPEWEAERAVFRELVDAADGVCTEEAMAIINRMHDEIARRAEAIVRAQLA